MSFLLSRTIIAAIVGAILFAPANTFAQQTSIPIALHRQEHNLSCEVAALKMALGVHGIDVSESELITHLPFDSTPRGNGIWGDPDQGFVGNIDGRMMVTGYGVHWDPIAKLGSRYAPTKVLQHSSAAELASAIAAGDPVIMWGTYGSPTIHSWQTPAGKTVRAVNGEHTLVVYGFDGPVHSPTTFYLMDPLAGQLRWSTQTLMNNWSSLGHMAVVVLAAPVRWVRVPGELKVWEISTDGTKRHWVTTWATLLQRGGASLIRAIDPAELATYRVGQPLK